MSFVKKKELLEIEKQDNFYDWNIVSFRKKWAMEAIDSRDFGIEKTINMLKEYKAKDVSDIWVDWTSKEKHLKNLIREWKIAGETSPVEYCGNCDSNCKSTDCFEKYGVKWCGWNSEKMDAEQANPWLDYYWFHDKKKNKTYSISEDRDYLGRKTSETLKIHCNNIPWVMYYTANWYIHIKDNVGLSELGQDLYHNIKDLDLFTKTIQSYWYKEKEDHNIV